MQRVESEPAMTAMSADHRVSVSTFAPSSSPASSSVLPVTIVSIISLSTAALLSVLVLSSLLLSGPAARSKTSGRAGLNAIDTHETLGG